MAELVKNLSQALSSLIILLAAVIAGISLDAILWRALRRVAEHTQSTLDDSLIKNLRKPARLIIPIVAVYLVMPSVRSGLSAHMAAISDNILTALLTLSIAWLLIRSVNILEDLVMRREDYTAKDNLQARRIYTQMQILKRLLTAIISVLALAALLLHYEEFRRLGTSILASAGLAGIVIGFAAQRTLGNLLAGIQIAITQPIRLDDVLIVEGEWGKVEEITLTYVVIRIWDLRRLIVPISYFVEKSFQNWTRVSADLLGTVFIYADYSLPVDDLRQELHRVLTHSKHWDGKVEGIQVTNATEQTLEIRALMSASDSSNAWDLRCEVREKLVDYIRREHPECLPRVRADLRQLQPGAEKR